MSTIPSSQIDQVCEKVDRLLERHERLQHQNGLLKAQLATVTQQRDALDARLTAARERIDALLARLPEAASVTASEPEPFDRTAVP